MIRIFIIPTRVEQKCDQIEIYRVNFQNKKKGRKVKTIYDTRHFVKIWS